MDRTVGAVLALDPVRIGESQRL